MDIVNVNRVYLDKSTFSGNGDIESVDLNNTPFVNNDGSSSFSNCSYLTSVSNISNTTTEMRGAFFNCSRMTVPPSIPNSLTQTAHVKTHNTYYGFIPDENTTIFVPWTESPALEWWFDGPITPGAHVNAWYNYYDEELEIYDKGEIEDVDIVSVDGQNITVDCWGEPESATRNAAGDFDDEPFMYPTINGMFESCQNLSNVPSLPNGITNIQGMFTSCYKLTNMPAIPDSVTNMCESFAFCRNLTDIQFGNNVTDISGAFAGCYSVTNIPTIPPSVTHIGSAFTGMVRLNTMPHIPNTVTNAVYKGVSQASGAEGSACYAYQLNKTFTTKYGKSYNVCYTRKHRTVPGLNGRIYIYVTNIDEPYASLSSVANVTSITGNTFSFTNNSVTYGATRAPELDIYWGRSFEDESSRDSYDYLASGAFEDCVRFTNAMDIEDGGLENMDLMFHGCVNLTTAYIPNSVNSMAYTFAACSSMTTAPTIPNSVTNMQGAFYGSGLTTTPVIPDSVLDMGSAFMCCYHLTTGPTAIGNSVTNMSKAFQQCNVMTSAPSVIPNSVTNMYFCFFGCEQIPTIPSDISSSVTDMGWAFNGCYNMRGRTNIYSTEVSSADNCFRNCTNSLQKNVYIPFTYQNGEYTNTYNAFTNAGYSTSSRVNGVQLFDLGVQG